MAEVSNEFYWETFFVKVCELLFSANRTLIDLLYLAIHICLGRRQALLCPSMRIRRIV